MESSTSESTRQASHDVTTTERKSEHLRLALDDATQLDVRFFEQYRFEHCALPELDYEELDVSVDFLGRRLRAPLVVSAMTGGTAAAAQINQNLATAAEACGVALGVGSQRAAIEHPPQEWTYQVRQYAPNIPLFANLGAVQLNYGYGIEQCRAAVDMVQADALVLHLNVLQEAIQPEGQTNFKGLLARIGAVARALDVPVIAKEIGCGISGRVGQLLLEQGVRIVDAAGLGGTSWARIEARRASDLELGESFADWGIPTPEAVRQLSAIAGLTVIASGGVRSGIDVAKAIALGAHLAGMAQPYLEPATVSAEAVIERIERTIRELKTAMLCVGARTLAQLKKVRISKGFTT